MTDAPSSTAVPATPVRRHRDRSPGYPGIPLSTAIERARTLWGEEGRNSAPPDAILHHWGYKPGVGPGNVAIAALKKFGLLTPHGGGFRLSDDALTILLSEDDDPARIAAIQRAALRPAIHSELWREHGGSLPSDTSLRLRLVRERGFTTNGASQFIAQFRRTVEYANLSGAVNLSPQDDDSQTGQEAAPMTVTAAPRGAPGAPPDHQPAPSPPAPPGTRSYTVPLTDGSEATLRLPLSLSETDWNLMMAVIGAMKPGIVRIVVTDAKQDHPDNA